MSSSYSTRWNPKALILMHIMIAIGLCTLFSPITHGLWKHVDYFIFKTINGTLSWGKPWQVFWALANHRGADWLEDIVILFFSWMYIKTGPKEDRLYRTSQIIFLLLYSAFIIFFVNKTLLRDHLRILRDSPTLIIEQSIKLSDHISWLKIKDGSSKSFPGDHGTTALLFGIAFVYLGNRTIKICAGIYALFLCLPRMILGAHWFTDIAIGSGSIAFFFLMWAFCTPFAHTVSSWIAYALKKPLKQTC